MFSLLSIILAFFAGILGALIGGTQTFICTGFIGLLIFLLEHVGVDTTFLNEALSNNLFYHVLSLMLQDLQLPMQEQNIT